jgi:DNA-binding transcriptional regulator YiaG
MTVSQERDLLRLARVRELAASGEARRLRETRRVTQSEIARAIGVQPAAVSRWEAGTRRPAGMAGLAYEALLAALAKAAS